MICQALRTMLVKKNHPQQSVRKETAALGSRVHLGLSVASSGGRWQGGVPVPSRTGQGSTHSVLHAHSLQGIVSLGCFPRQHDAVRSIQDGVGDVAALCTCRARLLDHAFQHLGENKPTGINTLPGEAAALQYSLWLGQKVGYNLKTPRVLRGMEQRGGSGP